MGDSTPKANDMSKSGKKLKQTRLSFPVVTGGPKGSSCKKLKLDKAPESSFSNKIETKENVELELDKKESLDEKNIIQIDDDDDVQLLDSFPIKQSPQKEEEKEKCVYTDSLEERDKTLHPIEINNIVTIKNSDNPMAFSSAGKSKPSDKTEIDNPDLEKTLRLTTISDANKRKISQDEEKESSINKKAKLDYKSKLCAFAKKSSGNQIEESVESGNNAELINSEENLVNNSIVVNDGAPIKEKDKVNMEVDTEVYIINDEKSSSSETKIQKADEDKVQNTLEEEANVSRHKIFHDFDSNPSSSSNDVTVTPVTPKSKKPPEEGSKKKSAKKLTPKQLEKKAESARKKQEKERLLEEKKKQKQKEEEEKRRKKEEKEEERKRLKEEKEKKRQMELDLKNEEKNRKEEEKRKKEEQKLEEKRKREEELQRKKDEESQQKKKFIKEAEAFSSFFKKVEMKSEPTVQTENKSAENTKFMPFTVKPDMRLAPINRNPMDAERLSKFENLLNSQSVIETYLMELRGKKMVPKKSGNTWPLEEKYEEVSVIEEDLELNDPSDAVPDKKRKNGHVKLLQFHENRRPPYWGTWRKKSTNITARRPLGKDSVFDYEVDSDDEWEEEEPGESLHGSDDEKEPEDDYEVDNDFFVPHGYLSDDENPEDETLTPETQKAKLKLLGEQFDLERNEKTKQLRPITIGCIWFKNDADEPEGVSLPVMKLLSKMKAMLWVETKPIILRKSEEISDTAASTNTTPSSSKKTSKFPESGVPLLISMIHGNTCKRKKISQKFLLHWKDEENQVSHGDNSVNMLTKTCVDKKIKELSAWQECPEEGPLFGRNCWYVKKEYREKYDLNNLPLPNKWDDLITISDGNPESAKKEPPPLITKYTKVLTEEERKSQLKLKSKARSLVNTPENKSPASGKKSAKKLQQFWSKSTNQPQNGMSEDMEVCIIEPQEVVQGKENLVNKSMKKMYEKGIVEKCNPEDSNCEITENSNKDEISELVVMSAEDQDLTSKTEGADPDVEIIANVQNKSGVGSRLLTSKAKTSETDRKNETAKLTEPLKAAATTTSTNNDGNSKPKKRVAILFSAPRGCEIKKSSVSNLEAPKNGNGASISKENTINDHKILVSNKSESEIAKENEGLKTDSSVPATNDKVNHEKPKPVKKRVPLLLSVPLGCEIKKTKTDSSEVEKSVTD